MTSIELFSIEPAEVTPGQLREAVWVLTGQALDACDGDPAAAVEAMRPVAEAIGARPYEPAIPRTLWGKPQQQGSSG